MKVLPSMPRVEQAKEQQKMLGKQSCVMALGQPWAGAQYGSYQQYDAWAWLLGTERDIAELRHASAHWRR